jgi:hypothetical protein
MHAETERANNPTLYINSLEKEMKSAHQYLDSQKYLQVNFPNDTH